jgi:hypothetical protein
MSPQYLLTALLSWNPATGARGATPDSVLEQYANAIADVCQTDIECLELAAVASQESRFAPQVLSYKCNRIQRSRGPCDGGHAYGAWQMHLGNWTCKDMRHTDIETQANIAMTLYRKRPWAWSTHRAAVRVARQYLKANPTDYQP